jgi:hypothetical protein
VTAPTWLALRKLLRLLLDGRERPEAISPETYRAAAALLAALLGDLEKVADRTQLERARALGVDPSTLWRSERE